MNNIGQAFQNGKVSIPFVARGDPDLENTKRSVRAAATASAGLMEPGIPFSDSMIEGPVIQTAGLRAFSGGVMTDAVFQMVTELCEELTASLVFMTYANVIFSCGIIRFAACMTEIGTGDTILPDMPFEEKEEFAPTFRAVGIDFISMITPTSITHTREIVATAEGFFYMIFSFGTTGMWQEINTDLSGMFVSVRQADPSLPAAIGFGVSTPAQTRRMATIAGGVIVGSAIVYIMTEKGCEAGEEITHYVREMKTVANTLQ